MPVRRCARSEGLPCRASASAAPGDTCPPGAALAPSYKPPAVGYDVQVRQSGEVVGRARIASRCRKEPNGYAERFYRCRPVRRKLG